MNTLRNIIRSKLKLFLTYPILRYSRMTAFSFQNMNYHQIYKYVNNIIVNDFFNKPIRI